VLTGLGATVGAFVVVEVFGLGAAVGFGVEAAGGANGGGALESAATDLAASAAVAAAFA
jgi:hypothetical protein